MRVRATARVHCFAGAGTLAMEVALVNHSSPGDRIVVVSHGFFSDRFAQIGETLGLRVDVLQVEWGEHAEPAALREIIAGGDAPADCLHDACRDEHRCARRLCAPCGDGARGGA